MYEMNIACVPKEQGYGNYIDIANLHEQNRLKGTKNKGNFLQNNAQNYFFFIFL